MKITVRIIAFTIIIFTLSCNNNQTIFQHDWTSAPNRVWIGSEFWANRLQDWEIKDGVIQCINRQYGLRTLHILPAVLSNNNSMFSCELNLNYNFYEKQDKDLVVSGLLIGAGRLDSDYRLRAIIQRGYGEGGGIIVGLNNHQEIVILNNENQREVIAAEKLDKPVNESTNIRLIVKAVPTGKSYQIEAIVKNENLELGRVSFNDISPDVLEGNVAIACQGLERDSTNFEFNSISLVGDKFQYIENQNYGPVLSAMYTVDNNNVRMNVQLPPLSDEDNQFVELEIKESTAHQWEFYAKTQLIVPGWTAVFDLNDLNLLKDYDYRVKYVMKINDLKEKNTYYQGKIVRNPEAKSEVVVAGFSCNSHVQDRLDASTNFTRDNIWFPHEDLFENAMKNNPDMLVFMGDQIYENKPTPKDDSGEFSTFLDYLYKWYLFTWSVNEYTRNLPTITIPDDHDVYHGNLWGCGGKEAPIKPKDGEYPSEYDGIERFWSIDQGGYYMPAEFVKMVERTQTDHLPDPYNPDPVKQGIEVYYTDLNFGRISFAILEDRKFKSAPSVELPNLNVVNGFSQVGWRPRNAYNSNSAELLGDRQLEFLEAWAGEWTNTDMKAIISQTIFANMLTYPDTLKTTESTTLLKPLPKGVIPNNYRIVKDMDSNGWPKSGRDKALKAIRKAHAVMIGGDQHLPALVKHGIDYWDDAGYSFAVPAIGNLWPRRWFPDGPGRDHVDSLPDYTGKYVDAFGNYINVWAAQNPYQTGVYPEKLNNNSVGYGIIKFNKPSKEVTFECWPRWIDPLSDSAYQFVGWPKTIHIEENYGRRPLNWLPEIIVSGLDNPPVIKVFKQATGEFVYAIRANDFSYTPRVFERGVYNIVVGEPGTDMLQTISNVNSLWTVRDDDKIELNFE